ncbi:MAG: alpha/beta hydrolase [Acidobacteria bacterium]|nr:alpha/beta hydrolase [Acidobacteriota bacterium]
MNKMTRRGFLGATLAGAAIPALGGIAAGQNVPPLADGLTVEKDVVFGKGGNLDLKLDIYRQRKGKGKRMATIHFHGGAFSAGSKDMLWRTIQPYALLGYVAIAPQYRLSGQAAFPALIHDTKAAIRWVRANAKKLGIEPDRIAVVGYSAGGYHALFTAGTGDRPEWEGTGGNPGVSTKVAACLAYYPATIVSRDMMSAVSPEDRSAAWATAHIAAGFPPTAIFHGFLDTTIPIDSSLRLVQQLRDQQLRDANVPVEFHGFEGVPHAFDTNMEFAVVAAQLADLFLDRHVVSPRTYPPFSGGRGGGRRGGRASP